MKHAPLRATDVRIKVHSDGLNPVDFELLEMDDFNESPDVLKPTPEAPFPIGIDVSGTIAEIGADVQGLNVGDAVFSAVPYGSYGTYAEYVAVDVSLAAPKPKRLTFDQAAGVPAVAETSYQVVTNFGKVKSGDRVLILGGSSVTGMVGIQIAEQIGAIVIATTSARDAELVMSIDADQFIDYTKEKWGEIIDAHSVDFIYDCGMEPYSWDTDAQKVLRKNTGIFVTIMPFKTKVQSPIGATHCPVVMTPSGKDLNELAKWLDEGKLVVPINSVFKFEDLLDAMKLLKSRRTRGKVILQVFGAGN
ncbi:Quinone oxidoreductase protein, partial [Globisporangium splendens]